MTIHGCFPRPENSAPVFLDDNRAFLAINDGKFDVEIVYCPYCGLNVRPIPKFDPREGVTIVSESNGVWSGYTVEPALDDESIRIVAWEGDEDSRLICNIWQIEEPRVRKRLRARAPYRESWFAYETPLEDGLDNAVVRAALVAYDRVVAERDEYSSPPAPPPHAAAGADSDVSR